MEDSHRDLGKEVVEHHVPHLRVAGDAGDLLGERVVGEDVRGELGRVRLPTPEPSGLGVSREQLRYVPDQHGGAVAGELVVIDRDIETGEQIDIDCTRFGSGAYAVPSWV